MSSSRLNEINSKDAPMKINNLETQNIEVLESGGILDIKGKTQITETSTDSLKLSGGITITSTTDSTDQFTGGSITTAGGLSVAKKSFFGGAIDLTGNTISNLGTPVNPTDAATKTFIEDNLRDLSLKEPVIAASDTTGTLSTSYTTTSVLDGITLTTGDRILLKNQANAVENGIYIVQTTGAPLRSNDFADGSNQPGSHVLVISGTVNANSFFICSTNLVGTDPISFTGISGGGGNTDLDLTAVNTAIIPVSNDTFSLGNTTNRFKNLFLSGNIISFANGLTIDSYNWSYLVNYIVPPKLAEEITNDSVLFNGPASQHSAFVRDTFLYTFGRNDQGQLGHGDFVETLIPTKVANLSGVKAVACGDSFTIVLLLDGTLKGTGLNSNGQLGNGTTTNSNTFVDIPVITTGEKISCGYNYTLVLLTDGTVFGFGSDANGQLGTSVSNLTVNTSPVLMEFPSGEICRFIDCGAYHSVILMENGSGYICGDNTHGQLALDPSIVAFSNTLVVIPGVSTLVSASAGHFHTILVNYLGDIITFGRNDFGQLGRNTKTPFEFDTATIIIQSATGELGLSTEVSGGLKHSVVIKGDNSIFVFGSNDLGQLGLGQSVVEQLTPTLLPNYSGFYVATGKNHTIIKTLPEPLTFTDIKSVLVSFGNNEFGQTGDNNQGISIRWTPNIIFDDSADRQLTLTSGSSYYLNPDENIIYACGYNLDGQLADSYTTNSESFKPISRLNSLDNIKFPENTFSPIHFIVSDYLGQVYTWGRNNEGQLGNNTSTNSSIPVNISSFGSLSGKTVISTSAGRLTSAAIDNTGQLHMWGDNVSSKLGNGTITDSPIPINTSSFGSLIGVTVVKVSTGHSTSLALDSTGTLHGWGSDSSNALGGAGNSTTPKIINNGSLSGKIIVNIFAGYNLGTVLDSDGEIHIWGWGNEGQLGNGSTANSIPINLMSFGSLVGKTITQVSPGFFFNLALDTNGQIHSWGSNSNGQLGNNSTTNSSVPINISSFGSLNSKIITQISAGGFHSGAFDSFGNLHVWGRNNNGQLGNNGTVDSLVPIIIDKTNRDYTLPILSNGGLSEHKLLVNTEDTDNFTTLFAIGKNTNRQLGDNTSVDRIFRVEVQTFGSNIIRTSVGEFNSACVLADGSGYIWGKNDFYQTGITNSTADVSSPSLLTQFAGQVIDIACGTTFSLVLLNDYTVYAIGNNANFQLGASTPTSSSSFLLITQLTDIRKIYCGVDNCAAVNSNGQTFVWGSNEYGKLGISSNDTNISVPVQLSQINYGSIVSVGLGANHSVISNRDSISFSCGLNLDGQLGISSNYNTVNINNAFTEIIVDYFISSVDCGYNHTVLQTSSNQALLFGNNSFGQTSISTNNVPYLFDYHNVVKISAAKNSTFLQDSTTYLLKHLGDTSFFGNISLNKPLDIVGGSYSGLITDAEGQLYSWGSNGSGQSTGTYSIPTNISSLGSISGKIVNSIGKGFENTTSSIVSDTLGQVHTFGDNISGQLGNNSTTDSSVPINVSSFGSLSGKFIVKVFKGQNNSAAIDNTGQLHMWGANGNNLLGNGSTVDSLIPINISSFGSLPNKNAVDFSSGNFCSFAVDSTGTLHGWGTESLSSFGGNSSSSIPKIINNGSLSGRNIVKVTAGNYLGTALDNTGDIHVWGTNFVGQSGTGANETIPINLMTFGSLVGKTITQVSTGYRFNLALDTNGQIHAWGGNNLGQIGNSTTTNATNPINISSFGSLVGKTVIKISAGYENSYAVDSQGNFHSWGRNIFATLGRTIIGTDNLIPGIMDISNIILLPSSFQNFTGQHRCFVENGNDLLKEGLLVSSNKNKYKTMLYENRISINESLPVLSITNTVFDKSIFGVISFVLENTSNLTSKELIKYRANGDSRIQINSIGEGAILVCNKGGPIEAGDYLTSSEIKGYSMNQNDSIMRNYTVAKATMDCDFTETFINTTRIKKDDYGNNILDENGSIIFENVLDENTYIIQEPFYRLIYLDNNSNEIQKEEYNEEIHFLGAFIGCTYHCG